MRLIRASDYSAFGGTSPRLCEGVVERRAVLATPLLLFPGEAGFSNGGGWTLEFVQSRRHCGGETCSANRQKIRATFPGKTPRGIVDADTHRRVTNTRPHRQDDFAKTFAPGDALWPTDESL
jgi:hypothetical protein